MSRRLVLMLLAGALAGCSPRAVAGTPTIVPRELKTSVRVQAEFLPGGFEAQAATPWRAQDVHHFALFVYRVEPASESLVTDSFGDLVGVRLERGALSSVRTLTPLRTDTTYRIRPFAYSKAEETSDSLISCSQASDFVEFRPAPADADLVTVPIRLRPVPFDGQLEWPGLDVQDGDLVASQSIRLEIGP